MRESFYDFQAITLDGKVQPFEAFRGKVLLIVNVASQCGFTPQYAGLETLYRKHRAAGLEVLGFPCNQFGSQEPDGEPEIARFCETRFGVTFPMFSKIDVNGPGAHPLYVWLKAAEPGILGTESIKWNFTKFLVGRDGSVVKRYAPTSTPESIEADVVAALSA